MIALQHLWLILQAGTTAIAPLDSSSLSGSGIACKGQAITRIDVHPRPPFEVRGSNLVKKALRFATDLHVTTKDVIVRRFLALKVGDECSEIRRAESERILRAQPFLADAAVSAIPDGAGGIILDVTTVDEPSLILGGGISAKSPHIRSVRLGESNLMGQAIYVSGEWRHAQNFRDVLRGKVTLYQFLGRPYQLAVWGGRREIGSDIAMEASHPFLTDLQKLSWRTTAGKEDGPFYFQRPNAEPVGLKFKRTYGDLGGVIRVGRPGSSVGLLGGSISHEVEDPAQLPFRIRDSVTVPDTSRALINRYQRGRSTRVNGLWGVRRVRYLRVAGFDALEGTQDLRLGSEVSTLLGKGVKTLGGADDDIFVSTDVYLGFGSRSSFAALDFSSEGRKPREGDWDGVLTHGRGAIYLKPFPSHTFTADATWSGGWNQRVPFQLTLSDREGGLRGFHDSDIGGARRAVVRMEDRYRAGHLGSFAAVGLAGFVDMGKLWAGDVPFGMTSNLSIGAGVSLLAALPSQSRRMWRVDLAYPIRGETRRGWEVRFSNRDFTRIFRNEPRDISSSRERSVPSSIFNWP
ncbi:MAG: hypothetical protein H0W63_01285 [Gemmatimonadaceae bacterium]|nr:hypothetical protein [Gemmatimonadaceae bacterium]